jgi:alkyl hydroperoxide reductase subunit AhpC
MAKRHSSLHRAAGRALADKAEMVKSDKRREVWCVNIGGERRTVVTTSTSGRVMDEAMRVFAPALKRLADR